MGSFCAIDRPVRPGAGKIGSVLHHSLLVGRASPPDFLRIGFVSQNRPPPAAWLTGNWVCFPKRGIEAMSHDWLQPRPRAHPAGQIGFVFHSRKAGSSSHNSFSAMSLSSLSALWKLGLFVQHASSPRPRSTGPPDTPAYASLALFCTLRPPGPRPTGEIGFVLRNPQSPIRNPKSENWLCFAELRCMSVSP